MTRQREYSFAAGLGLLGAAVAVIVSRGQVAGGPDAVSYLSLAESLRHGGGFGNWLESPMATFPPGWPVIIWGFSILGLGAEWSATVAIALSLLALPPLALVVLRRCTDVAEVRLLGVACVALSPIVLPWGFLALSEVPFAALVLGSIAAAVVALTPDRARLIWLAVACAAVLPTMRYAGVAVPLTLAAWIAMVWPRRRLLTAAAAALLGLLPLAAVLVHNFVVIGSLFGSRAPSSLNPLQATMQGIVASGRGTLWAIDAVPGPAAALAGVLLGAVVLYAVCSKGASEPSPHGHAARLLVAAMAVTQVAVLVVARSRAEIDDLNDRLLAPASVLMLLVVVAVVGDLARADRVIIRRVAVASLAAWMVIGVAATARAVRNGNENGYSGPSWEAIRDSHALEAVPEDCRRSDVAAVLTAAADTECVVLANDPWGWYPGGVQPLMSPRRNSEFDGSSDLDRVTEAVESGVSVYVLRTSVTEPYGYLLTPDEWGANLEVEQLAVDGRLEVLRLNPGA